MGRIQVKESVGVALRVMREQKGESVAEAAKGMGVGRSTLHRWENALSSPDVNDVANAAAYYGTTPADFFPPPEPPTEYEALVRAERSIAQARTMIQSLTSTREEG